MKRLQGRYLKILREERGYSLRTFADMIYTSKSSLQRWEKSYLPDDDEMIKRMAEALDMDVERFIQKCYSPKLTDDGLSADQRAEAKFGLNGLKTAFIAVGILAAALIATPIILLAILL